MITLQSVYVSENLVVQTVRDYFDDSFRLTISIAYLLTPATTYPHMPSPRSKRVDLRWHQVHSTLARGLQPFMLEHFCAVFPLPELPKFLLHMLVQGN